VASPGSAGNATAAGGIVVTTPRRCRHLTTVSDPAAPVSLERAHATGSITKEAAVTQTMPERVTVTGEAGPGAELDDDDLVAAVRALEARKALLAGALAAMTAPDELATALFEAALAEPGALSWPFDLARMQLLYGERLRRARQITRSRQHLQAALTAFELMGASAWAERAAAELAATSPAGQGRGASRPDPLTGQELQIAELAAAGLANKQIGARLYLSHRTVSAHLYRVFPKLGISSRAALRDALTRQGGPAAVAGV
jgi:DNA-binding CsgD family transcriptional regulator